ncbi:MAG: biotin/lipoyl-containing protein, partial [Alphaproteobacteria bacterium]
MSIEVKVPSVGESVTSGVISAWHKKSGEFVNEGEPLFALETDKVSTDIVADKSGVLETRVPEGQEVKIGEVVAVIDDSKGATQEKKSAPLLDKKTPRPERDKKAANVAAGGDRSGPPADAELAQAESTPPVTDLSPAVRRIAEEEKIALEGIAGTGAGGRLTKADVLKVVETRGKTGSSDMA